MNQIKITSANYNIDADPTIPDAYLDPTDSIAIQAKANIPQIKDPANAYLREIQRRLNHE